MAVIPQYQQQRTIPGTTGMKEVPLSLAQNNAAGAAEAGFKLVQGVSDAMDRVQRREDAINRTRAINDFQTEIGTEWQRIKDQEDLSRPETLQKFNQFAENARAKAMSIGGSKDSMAALDTKISELSGTYERAAISGMREAQINILKKSYGNEINPILTGVTDGSMTIEAAFQRINEISQEIGGSEEKGWNLPRGMVFDMHDAAQSAVAVASIERHLSTGNFQSARDELNRHPEFATVMDTGQMAKIVKRISDQEFAYNSANQKVMIERDIKAQDFGFANWRSVPQSFKIAIATGQPIPGTEKFTPTTDFGKILKDRSDLQRLYSHNPEILRQFDALVAADRAAKMNSDIGKYFNDLERLQVAGKKAGDPEYDAIKNKINSLNPEFVANQEKIAKFPAAQVALDTFTRQAERTRDDAKKAIMLWTGEDNWEAAQKAVADGDVSFWTTGYVGQIASVRMGSNVNEIQSILTRIGGKEMLNALAALKAASPTGATGMGALNETEGKALMFTEGSLDIKAPKTTIATLMDMINNTDSAIANQQNIFNSTFGSLPQGKPGDGTTAPAKQTTKTTTSSGAIRYGADGKPK